MSLSSASPTINALGIFGRLDPPQQKYFDSLEDKFSSFPQGDESIGIFNHLSLVIEKNVFVGKLQKYIDLLKELKSYLPFKINVSGVIIKDEKHLALSFDIKQTEKIREIASRLIPEGVVTTYYTKVVWHVPKEKQAEVITILKEVKIMTFYDFVLCANREDEKSIIYSSNRYK